MKRQKVIDLECVDKTKNDKLPLNWDNVLGEEEEQVPELEVIGSDKTSPATLSGDDSDVCVKSLKDHELDDELKRKRSLLALSHRLPDKGEKIRIRIGNLEYEKQRRMFQPTKTKTDADKCQTPVHPNSSGVLRQENTASKDTSRQGNTGTREVSRSTFASHFSGKTKQVDAQPVKLCNEEPRDVGRESWKRKADIERKSKQDNGWLSVPRLDKPRIHERKFYSEYKDPKGNRKRGEPSVKRKQKDSSPYVLVDNDDEDDVIGYDTPRDWSSKASPSLGSSCRRKKPDDNVINLDEDEDEPQSSMVAEEAFEIPKGLPESFCYPIWDDPDCVEVSLNDLKCLSPQEYLNSPVINFYMRFLQLQVFAGNQTAANSHFFNTFFYKKLTEALSYKGNDKDAFFVKFRRWWKGSDLFRKSYIFIPIHEDLHWSLVIISIPDMEDYSGLTLLHLDSLGLHPTNVIFTNVKRFLTEEWNYLNQDDPSLDLPISEIVWSELPQMINEPKLQVPQQKNDFDCGLFVLFFIKRFIEDAPQRLKLEDLAMINKKWFQPNEASSLRIKIWNILIDLFRNSVQGDSICTEQKIPDLLS